MKFKIKKKQTGFIPRSNRFSFLAILRRRGKSGKPIKPVVRPRGGIFFWEGIIMRAHKRMHGWTLGKDSRHSRPWLSSTAVLREFITPGRGGGTPLYKLYRYVPPHRVGFLHRFVLKAGIYFAYFGLESGMVFEGTTRAYERIYRFNSKWITTK